MIPIEILEKYSMTSIEWYKDRHGDYIETEIGFYQTFLQQTDCVPSEIFERLIEDLATATLANFVGVLFNFLTDIRIEYKKILQYRKFAREEINRLNEVITQNKNEESEESNNESN